MSPPRFRQDGGQFVQTLGRPSLAATTEVTTDVTTDVRFLTGEMTRVQLQAALGLENDEHFRKACLQPALEAGLIERTLPGKPRSTKQKYRLTALGARRKAEGR